MQSNLDPHTSKVCEDVKFTTSKSSAVQPIINSLSSQRSNAGHLKELIKTHEYVDYGLSFLPYLIPPVVLLFLFFFSMYTLSLMVVQ